MDYFWTEERVNWYLTASSQSSFHRRLAEYLRPYLRPEDRVADLGCGLGRLDLELAPFVAHITCVDRDPGVLGLLEWEAEARGLDNLSLLCRDPEELEDQFDTVVMCFFGTSLSLMLRCAALARRRLIRIMNAAPTPAHMSAEARQETPDEVANVLERAGLPFRLLRLRLDFGQPLRSREEGLHFLLDYHPDFLPAQCQRILDRDARPTGDPRFPLYLPKEKELGIFVVETAQPPIPH